MRDLGTLAKGINIGDMATSIFAGFAANRECGRGLFHDTTNQGFRRGNFVNNYRYTPSYYNILSKLHKTESKRYFYGDLIDAPNIDGIDIGWAYTTDLNKYRFDKGFISNADFDKFQSLLRERALFKSLNEFEYQDRFYLDLENSSNFVASGVSKEMNRGDLYEVPEEYEIFLPKNKVSLGDSAIQENCRLFHEELNNIFFSAQRDSNGNLYKHTEREVKRTESLFSKAQKIRYNITGDKKFINQVIKEKGLIDNRLKIFDDSTTEFTIEGNYFQILDLKQDVKKIRPFLNDVSADGLRTYYNEYRNKNLSLGESLKGLRSHYKFDNAYAVENDTISEYIVDKNSGVENRVPVTKYNDGFLNSYDKKREIRTYQYFEEPDNTTPRSSFNKTNVSDGSQVVIDSFSNNNTSKLLSYTNRLFRGLEIDSLVNRFHTQKQEKSDLITAYNDEFGLSRGRNLIVKEYENKQFGDKSSGYDNPYCRVWTAHHQYSKLKDRIRPFVNEEGGFVGIGETQKNLHNLRPNNGAERLNDNSVLQPNGFVKITPTHNHRSKEDVKKYMFSIENLAWRDINNSILSTEQKGPNNGRIMWFPPYNLKFSENVTVNWNPNNFIGRGEQIFTYTNTDRSGTLDFTLLIDHPSSINKWRGMSQSLENKEECEQDILRYFAGCGNFEIDAKGKPDESIENKLNNNEIIDNNLKPQKQTKELAYVVFFPNDFSAIDSISDGEINNAIESIKKYEWDDSEITIPNRDKTFENEILLTTNENNRNSGKALNNFNESTKALIRDYVFNSNDENLEIGSFNELLSINKKLGEILNSSGANNFKLESIEVKGFASSHGYIRNNKDLCKRRARFLKNVIQNICTYSSPDIFTELDGEIKVVNKEGGRGDINKLDAKLARAAIAIFKISWVDDVKAYNSPTNSDFISVNGLDLTTPEQRNENKILSQTNEMTLVTQQNEDTDYNNYNEYMYFAEINSGEENMIRKHIVDKIRYFDPAFHSITPEGFNARLNFLHQCTRQGPTNEVNSGNVTVSSNNYQKYAGNLSFGRAPYCILRIGDFFYTKICIDSLSIQYENDGGVQWDLNPEGAGVQPMMAHISMNFKFLGGQDISGPIERLQNAVSSNFYANSSVYDKMADYDNKRFNPITGQYYK